MKEKKKQAAVTKGIGVFEETKQDRILKGLQVILQLNVNKWKNNRNGYFQENKFSNIRLVYLLKLNIKAYPYHPFVLI